MVLACDMISQDHVVKVSYHYTKNEEILKGNFSFCAVCDIMGGSSS